MAIKAIFFDIGGTLADCSADVISTINYMRRQREYTPFSPEQIKPWIGRDLRSLICATVPVSLPPENYENAITEFCAIYYGLNNIGSVVFSGIPELLAELKDNGIKVVAVSRENIENSEKILFRTKIEVDELIHGGYDYRGSRGVALTAQLRKWKIQPGDAIYVTNREIGVEDAKRAEIQPYCAGWGHVHSDFLESSLNHGEFVEWPAGVMDIIRQSCEGL